MKPHDPSAVDTRRRFEQWANNPHCVANAASAILNVPMRKVAEAEGLKAPFGQSPFALARGQSFERAMFRNEAAVLREELVAAGVLPADAKGFADFRYRRQGGPIDDVEDALADTLKWLREIAAGNIDRSIAAGATIRIPGGVMLPQATLAIDALVVRVVDGNPRLIVGEVKVYPDRGGYTDESQLAGSRAQAGLYVHGVRLTLEQAGLAEKVAVDPTGFLVLSKSGSNRISLRANEDFSGQAERAKTGLATLSDVAQRLDLNPAAGFNEIQKAKVSYCESCVAFCERADLCRSRAEAAGEGSVLGDEVHRFLGEVTLVRVAELSQGAKPKDEHEREIVRLLALTEGSDGR
jgi:hypothetical protein